MEIRFEKKGYGMELSFKADNVLVTEDLEERIYQKLDNGNADFTKSPQRDVSTDAMEQFTRLLDDMTYYREREFDSSGLIERLFDKLPAKIASELVLKLHGTFAAE